MRNILIAAALAALVAPALAQETRASAAAKLTAEFAASDTDRNGALTLPEVQARIGRMKAGKTALKPAQARQLAGLWFSGTDANHDGKVTRAESQAAMAKIFDRYDIDKDGTIAGEESRAARAAARGAVKAKPPTGR